MNAVGYVVAMVIAGVVAGLTVLYGSQHGVIPWIDSHIAQHDEKPVVYGACIAPAQQHNMTLLVSTLLGNPVDSTAVAASAATAEAGGGATCSTFEDLLHATCIRFQGGRAPEGEAICSNFSATTTADKNP